MMKVELWRQTVITLTCRKIPENPFLDIEIIGVFVGPNGELIRREAYWDGENRYGLSFAPVAIGVWRYTIDAPEETGLNGLSGELECVPYTGELPIYQHGFLRVSDNNRFLCHADGTPFFWLGDTHWAFAAEERWDESNHPAMDSMFRGIADRRAAQGFTVYQTNLRCNEHEDLFWDSESETDRPNISYFRQELDRRMQYIADLGFVNALGVGWFQAAQSDTLRVKRFVRYLTARYGSLPVVWTLAGEVAGYFPDPRRSRFLENWKDIARYQASIDGYHNLQTAHATNERPFFDAYYDEEWFDFTLNQAGHGDLPINAHWYRLFRATHSPKPFVEGEAFYEFVSTLEENGTRLCTPDMLRRVAYISMQTGGCGYTYGAQGIWDCVWEKGMPQTDRGFNAFDVTWVEAVDGIGAVQMGYMKRFYMGQRFWELSPHDEEEEIHTADPFALKKPLALASADGRRWILYYTYDISSWMKPQLHGFNDGVYRGRWFDPRTGAYLTKEVSAISEGGTLTAPGIPDRSDWLLVLEQNDEKECKSK